MSEGDEAVPLTPKEARSLRLIDATRKAILEPPRGANWALLLIVSLGVFVLTMQKDTKGLDLAILVGVLFLHESGHLVGMRLFGFSDLRMFFLPFLGAAASGRKFGASAGEHAVVSLAGPVPGIVLAAALLPFVESGHMRGEALPPVALTVITLVAINTLNLLPILPMDGGRLFQSLLFQRMPVLDVVFQVLALGGIAWAAVQFGNPFWLLLTIFGMSIPSQSRMAFDAHRLARSRTLSADPEALTDEDLIALRQAADRICALPFSGGTRPRNVAATVRRLFDRAVRPQASWGQVVGLLFVWLVSVAGGVVVLALALRTLAHR